VGVLLASVLPSWLGLDATTAVLALGLVLGLTAVPAAGAGGAATARQTALPLHHGRMPALAGCWPSSCSTGWPPPSRHLLPFFVADRLQPPHCSRYCCCFFGAAALGLPLWVKAVSRWGLAPSWRAGMLASVLVFGCTLAGRWRRHGLRRDLPGQRVGPGRGPGPAGALLTGVIHNPAKAVGEGRYLGWWTCATNSTWPWRQAWPCRCCVTGGLPQRRHRSERPAGTGLGLWRAALPAQAGSGSAALARRATAFFLEAHMSHISHSTSFSPLRRICLGAHWHCPGRLRRASVQDYAKEQPQLDLRQYFNGPLTAHGMFTDRSGKVVKRFTVRMTGRWKGDEGTLDEHFVYSDGSTQQRTWHLRHLGDGRYSGRADDVVGEAQGQSAGNAIRWSYVLALPVDGRVWNVRMDDWMYLMDGRTLLNRPP
jgi:hypothetical protein